MIIIVHKIITQNLIRDKIMIQSLIRHSIIVIIMIILMRRKIVNGDELRIQYLMNVFLNINYFWLLNRNTSDE